MTMRKCANCKGRFDTNEEPYIVYGGIVFHDETCLAEYYVEHTHRFERVGKDIDDVAELIEHRKPFTSIEVEE